MADIGIFHGLDATDKARVRQMTRQELRRKGETIFHAGTQADTVYLVTAGQAKLFKLSNDGKEVMLGFLRPPALFGLDAMFGEETYTMSAQAMEDTWLCVCRQQEFITLLLANPHLSLQVLRALGKQWVDLSDQLTDLALRDVQGRVAGTLLRLCDAYGRATAHGYEFDFHLTHQDLAALVGASRVMVTSVLGTLRKAGCVEMERHHIRRLHPHRLQAVWEQDRPEAS
ncbi:MAG: Crp/Fnr family transcriptional regulator [Candidatus Tectimicrobiota bacterium]